MGILKDFIEEVRIAKKIIEKYPKHLVPVSKMGVEETDIKEYIEDIEVFFTLAPMEDANWSELEKEFNEKGLVLINSDNANGSSVEITEDTIHDILLPISLIKIIFLFNCIPLISISQDSVNIAVNVRSLFKDQDNQVLSQEEIAFAMSLLPPISKEEFYYAIKLLPDYLLRQCLTEFGVFDNLYSFIKKGNKEAFISNVPNNSKEFYYSGVMLFLMQTKEFNERIDKLWKGEESKQIELGYILAKPLYDFFNSINRLQATYSIDFKDENPDISEGELIKIQEKILKDILNVLPSLTGFVLNNNYPLNVKGEIKEGYQILNDVFKLDVANPKSIEDYTNEERERLMQSMFPHFYTVMTDMINEKKFLRTHQDSPIIDVDSKPKIHSNFGKNRMNISNWILKRCDELSKRNPHILYDRVLDYLYEILIGVRSMDFEPFNTPLQYMECSREDFKYLLGSTSISNDKVSSNPQINWINNENQVELRAFLQSFYCNDRKGLKFDKGLNPGRKTKCYTYDGEKILLSQNPYETMNLVPIWKKGLNDIIELAAKES